MVCYVGKVILLPYGKKMPWVLGIRANVVGVERLMQKVYKSSLHIEPFMPAITAADAKKSFFDLMDRVIQKREIVRIRSEAVGEVFLSEKKFEGMQETLALLSTKGFREDFDRALTEVEKGDTRSFEEVFGECP